jgi:hypothetical protein
MSRTRSMSLKRVMSIKEFCDEYAVGPTRFYEEVKRGRICLSKLGRKSLVTRDEAERWLKNLPTAGADRDPRDGDQNPAARIGEEPTVRSSVKPSHPAANDNLKDELIRRTCEVWQPRLGRDPSGEEVRQIAENVTGFFTVLAEWSRVEMPAPANDTGKLDASETDGGHHDR